MESAARIEYLQAMGVDVWALRRTGGATGAATAAADPASSAADGPAAGPAESGAASAPTGLVIGPGDGRLLLVCDRPEDAARAVATDIVRCLDGGTVWAWPASSDGGGAMTIEAAIRERLFTGLLVFGQQAMACTGATGDTVRGSARLVRAPSLAELESSPDARRDLWRRLRETDWCVARDRSGRAS